METYGGPPHERLSIVVDTPGCSNAPDRIPRCHPVAGHNGDESCGGPDALHWPLSLSWLLGLLASSSDGFIRFTCGHRDVSKLGLHFLAQQARDSEQPVQTEAVDKRSQWPPLGLANNTTPYRSHRCRLADNNIAHRLRNASATDQSALEE